MRYLCTYADDAMHRVAYYTNPRMQEYAKRYGYKFISSLPDNYMRYDRPPSWLKLEFFNYAFDQGAKEVLWLDADVMIVDMTRDVMSYMPENNSAMLGAVVHQSHYGNTPNAGVLCMVKENFSMDIEMRARKFRASSGVWEQAGVEHMWGFNPDSALPKQISHERRDGLVDLPYIFNVSYYDYRDLPHDSAFIHLCALSNDMRIDRLESKDTLCSIYKEPLR